MASSLPSISELERLREQKRVLDQSIQEAENRHRTTQRERQDAEQRYEKAVRKLADGAPDATCAKIKGEVEALERQEQSIALLVQDLRRERSKIWVLLGPLENDDFERQTLIRLEGLHTAYQEAVKREQEADKALIVARDARLKAWWAFKGVKDQVDLDKELKARQEANANVRRPIKTGEVVPLTQVRYDEEVS